MPSDSTPSVPPTDAASGESSASNRAAPLRAGSARPGERTVISREQPLSAPLHLPVPRGDLEQQLVGERLEHFELQEFVGGGGMGSVFRALDTRLNRSVALKVLSREQAIDEETARRFQNEAQAAARLDHDGIARVYYVGEDQGLHFIVFEFIDGTNVREVVSQRGSLQPAEAVRITLQVADALSHAAGRKVVHRDIKPSNILITPDGRAKLVDMGLARQHRLNESAEDLTASGVTLGTFDYISPEQARDPRVADVRSDIYSLGCTLYFMLTGRPPFPEGTVLQKLLHHQNDTPTDPRQFAADLPPELVQVLFRMLAKEPAHRYQDPGDLVHDLFVLARQWGWEEAVPPATLETRPITSLASPGFFERTAPIWIPLAGLALVVAGVQLWSQWSEPLSASVGLASGAHHMTRQASAATTGRRKPAETSLQPFQPPNGARDVAPSRKSSPAGQQPGDPAASTAALAPSPTTSTADPADAPTRTPEDSAPPQPASGPAPPNGLSTGETSVSDDSPAVDEIGSSPADPVTAPPPSQEPTSAVDPSSTPNAIPLPEGPEGSVDGSLPPVRIHIVRGPQEPEAEVLLQAACDLAADGDVIELQFNGAVLTSPVKLEHRDLTLRAAEGFRPTLLFRPRSSRAATSPGMIRVVGGHLACIGVGLQCELPTTDEPTAGWALFALDRAEIVQLDRCLLTLGNAALNEPNAYHPEASFFWLADVEEDRTATPPLGAHLNSGRDSESIVRLTDCVLRGEASVLSAAQRQSVSLQWHNGLAALSEPFLRVRAEREAHKSSAPLRIEIEHLSLDVPQGLVAMDATGDVPSKSHVALTCTNSILRGEPGAALIVEQGGLIAQDAPRRLHWKSDRNVYEGFAVFWRRLDPASRDLIEETAWSDWKSFWSGSREARGSAGWSAAVDQQAPHERVPDDYRLAARSPARQGAVDLSDCGAALDRLPSDLAETRPAAAAPPQNTSRANQFGSGREEPKAGPPAGLQPLPPPG